MSVIDNIERVLRLPLEAPVRLLRGRAADRAAFWAWRVLGVPMLPLCLWELSRPGQPWNRREDGTACAFGHRVYLAWAMWQARYWVDWDIESVAKERGA